MNTNEVLNKLKTEIEKNTPNHLMLMVYRDHILALIDSLQQEQPDNEDVDKVAQELYEHLYELKRRNNVPTNLYDKQEIIDLWKAGIVYGRSHPKQEQPKVDLDTEIHEKAVQLHTAPTYEELEKFARHFYELGLKARRGNNDTRTIQ